MHFNNTFILEISSYYFYIVHVGFLHISRSHFFQSRFAKFRENATDGHPWVVPKSEIRGFDSNIGCHIHKNINVR